MNKQTWTIGTLALFSSALFVTILFTKQEFLVPPSSQIAAVSGDGSGLVGHWMFDDNANDSAGSNNGTLIGESS